MNIPKKPFSKKKELSTIQLIVIFYLSALIISTLLLKIPLAHRENASISYIDALFTSASAVSVTGLSVISLKDTFNHFGIFLLCIILQIGGLGVMSLSTFLWIMIGKKVGLITIISVEIIGGIILGLRFLNYYESPLSAFKHGFFGSISATTNAGFDITGSSLIPFNNDYFAQTVIIFLMIIGAIGFPVIVEVYEFFLSLKSKKRYHFTLFTKLTTSTFVILTIVGGLIIYSIVIILLLINPGMKLFFIHYLIQ
jgi:Trk-type K+ transport system membrane component